MMTQISAGSVKSSVSLSAFCEMALLLFLRTAIPPYDRFDVNS